MLELFFFLGLALFIGFVALLIKAGVFLVLIPVKLGLGLVKLLFALLIGIPVLVVMIALAGAALPILLLVVPILCILALPFVLFFKVLF